jgi:AraC family transcriptional regulator
LTRRTSPVFQETDACDQKKVVGAAALRREFPRTETHGIALWPKHQLMLDSRGLGWHDVYTSLAAESSWSRTLQAVPHLCLAYCLHGRAAVTRRIDGQQGVADTELRPRLLGVVPEQRLSMWNLRGRPVIQLVYLRRPMVERVAQEAMGLDAARIEMVPQLGFADPLLEQLMLELLDAAREDDGGGNGLYADHLAQMMALRVLRRHVSRPGRVSRHLPHALDSRMRRVCALIDSALDEDLSLERLAREAGVGAHAFSSAFAKAVGMTPHRYVLNRRIERAKTLLLAGVLPLAEVALQTGFASQSHMASAFKRLVGVTPSEYRRG